MTNLKTCLCLSILVLGSVSAVAAPSGPSDYSAWKNQPSDRFSDAEANFDRVKKILLEQHFDKGLTEERLYQAAADGMLRALNGEGQEAWNKLITPTELKEIENDLKGEVTGIGIEIKFDQDTGIVTITGLIPGSAAEKGGLKAGDQIVSIDGQRHKGAQFRDVVYAIRGKIGEKVRLKVLRGDEIIKKDIMRERIAWSPVDDAIIEGKTGVLTIRYFNETTGKLVRESLERLKSRGITSLIIDLRGNSGGLFDEAVKTAGYFLPAGATVVRVASRDGKEEVLKAKGGPVIQDLPIVLVVDETTCSGAELFAAAIADNLGAKKVGEKTKGKWNAQKIENLPNHFAIKFTTRMFKSPKGRSYQGEGMVPDIVVASAEEFPKSGGKRGDLMADASLRAAYHFLSRSP